MKKTLSLLLAVIMVLSMVPFAAFAEETTEDTRATSVVSSTELVLGENTVEVASDAITTIFAFEPEEAGEYTFTAAEGIKLGYWGAGSYFTYDATENKTNTLTQTISAVGQTIMVGVTDATGSVAITVEKSGEYVDTSIKYTTYANTHTPTAEGGNACYTGAGAASGTYVLGSDGFYHLDSTEGDLVVVNLASSAMSLTAMVATSAAKYVEQDADGNVTKAVDYTDALTAYCNVKGNYYPLTADLYTMLPEICAAKGWVESGYLTAWTDLCEIAEVSHTAGSEQVENETDTQYDSVYYCTVCGVEISRDTVLIEGTEANPIFLYANENTVTNEGTTYYQGYFSGMVMTVTGETGFSVIYNGETVADTNGVVSMTVSSVNPRYPVVFAIVGDGEYTVNFTYPAGSYMNPDTLNLDVNLASIEANSNGYYYTWTAPTCGVLSITMPNAGGWFYVINNLTTGSYGDSQWNDSDPVVNPGTVTVAYGDEIQIIVNTYDPDDMWNTPAGTLTITASFEEKHDAVHQEAVEAGCHYDGNIEYWYCSGCGAVWQDEALTQLTNIKNVILPATGEGLLVHMDAVEPACHYDGNVEYWICYTCEQVWQDEALTQLTNIKNVVLPATGGDVTHVEAKEATCYENGNIEYWYCEECEQVWQDEALTQLTNFRNVVTPALEHQNVIHFEAVEPGCHYDGNIEYWYCPDCETVWQDEALTQLTNIKNVILPATGGDVTHFEAVEPGCHYDGNIEYWVCYDCEQVWQDEALTQLTNIKNVVLPATGGDVTHFEAVEPACHYDGNIEYWVCYDCEQVWQDEALTQLTNIKNVVLPATGGDVTHVEAKEATCYENGNIEYWYCEECQQVWQDEALTQLTNFRNVVTPALEHQNVIHFEAVEPGCHYDGNIEYWYCPDCQTVWQDEALTQLTNIKNVVLPATGGDVEHFEAVEPACHYDGNIEYWVCYDCEQVWQDEALTQLTNIKNVVLPATGGDVTHFEAVEPGCHYDGNIEYWVCYDCEQVWQDEALTQLTNIKNVVLPATGGDVVHFEAVEPGCHYDGNIEYWVCYDCEQVWQDEALTQLTNIKNVVLPATGGDIIHVEAKEATCYENGNIEYWYCADCEQVWQDESLTQLTNAKNVVIGAAHTLAHVEAVEPTCSSMGNIEYWYCTECGAHFLDEYANQNTNALSVILPTTDHKSVEHYEAVEAGCHNMGNVEHWYCSDCGCYYADEALKNEIFERDVILPATGAVDVTKVGAVAPTCEKNGNIEYYVCGGCGGYFAEEACIHEYMTSKDVVDPAIGHDWDDGVVTKAATCETKGEKTYTCKNDKSHTKTEEFSALGHKWDEGTVTKKPTCTAKGEKTYTCENDKSHTKTEEIAANGHSYSKGKCTVCGAEDPNYKETTDNAQTGDNLIVLWTTVMILAAALVVLMIVKKRRTA